jgi:Ca2+-binding RTX toxin-like protein
LIGGPLNDTLDGGAGNDRLIGVQPDFPELEFGLNDIDTLTGGINNDTFVLGQKVNGSNVVFYNNGITNDPGVRDYALITDFGFAGDGKELGVDKIQLAGSTANYSLGSSPTNLPTGTGIFYTTGQTAPELIGIVQNISSSQLNLANTNYFTFV